MSNRYADHDGYKRVEAYVAWVVDSDPPDAGWAKKVLSDEARFGKLVERMLGNVRDSRKNDPEWKGLSARRRWVEAAVREALQGLASRRATVEWLD